MNTFCGNIHTVPLIDLFTLNVLIIIAIAYGVKYAGYTNTQALICLAVLLVLSIVVCPMMGVSSNLSYYFGQGPRPAGWKY